MIYFMKLSPINSSSQRSSLQNTLDWFQDLHSKVKIVFGPSPLFFQRSNKFLWYLIIAIYSFLYFNTYRHKFVYPYSNFTWFFEPPALTEGFISSALPVRPSICVSICNALFSGFAHYFIWFFYMKLALTINTKKGRSLFCQINSCYAQNGKNWQFFLSKSTLLNFSLNLVCTYFWKCTTWRALK